MSPTTMSLLSLVRSLLSPTSTSTTPGFSMPGFTSPGTPRKVGNGDQRERKIKRERVKEKERKICWREKKVEINTIQSYFRRYIQYSQYKKRLFTRSVVILAHPDFLQHNRRSNCQPSAYKTASTMYIWDTKYGTRSRRYLQLTQ